MSQRGYPGTAGDSDPSSFESLQLAQAITEAHKKWLFAEKRNAMMQIGEVENSSRPRKLGLKDYGQGLQRHVAVALMPAGQQETETPIARMVLDFPTVQWEAAGDALRAMYLANIKENAPKQFDETSAVDLSRPAYIPTRDVFGEAIKSDGSSIKFLLSPTGLHAYELPEDIIPTAPEVVAAGQLYVVFSDFATYEAQAKLATEWFNTSDLIELIGAAEVTDFDGNTGTSAAAG
ncbi:MAG: hypothetical protein JWN82_351 [Candidatus Saccharibacteria bacterium]|nr:hypothetical protein [Candidatus Saccharibacteria bacterium]